MRIVWAMVAGLFLAGPGQAGDLSVTGAGPLPGELRLVDGRYACTHVFNGPFEAGDAEKIIAAAPDLLCLDSPGGSLSEALTLTAWMKDNPLGTKVTATARCLSACALVFMAGNRLPIEGRSAYFWRVLEPGGRLGFHAPSLNVPDGNYNEATVTEAYDVSTRAIGRIITDLAMRVDLTGAAMKLSLLGEMLATPPDQMMIIETVDQAGRWDIAIPVQRGAWPPDNRELGQICVNKQAWVNDLSAIQSWLPEFYPWDDGDTPTSLRGRVTLNEISGDGCSITVEKQGAPHYLFMELEYEGTVYYDPLQRFAPETPLVALPVDKSSPREGRCIIARDGVDQDSQPCSENMTAAAGGVERVYTWPSGQTTVVEEKVDADGFEQTYIAGNHTYPEDLGTRICWLNSATGNSFCFERG